MSSAQSSGNDKALDRQEDERQQVIDYLSEHPELLLQEPDLLGQLELNHQSGCAVSLIERQVQSLRDQVERYQRQLGELVTVARDNEQVNQRLHNLTLELIAALDSEEVGRILEKSLRQDFQAVAFALLEQEKLRQRAELHALGDRQQVSCGRLGGQQLKALFAEEAEQVRSVALVPLSSVGYQGLLAIGSSDENRFHSDMGTDYLQRLGEVIARTLEVVSEPGI